MDPIEGVNLIEAFKQADSGYSKVVTARVSEYIKSLKVQAHNLLMKELRLRTEADQAASSRKTIEERLKNIQYGDWSAVEPFEMNAAPNNPPR